MGFRIRESSRLDSKVIVFTIIRNTATTTATTTVATTTRKWLKYNVQSGVSSVYEFYCPDFTTGSTPVYLDVGIYFRFTPSLSFPYNIFGGGFFYPSNTICRSNKGEVIPLKFSIDGNKNVELHIILDSIDSVMFDIIKLTWSTQDIHISLQQLLLYAQEVHELNDNLFKNLNVPSPASNILTDIDTIIQNIKVTATTTASHTFTTPINTNLDNNVSSIINTYNISTKNNLTILAQATAAAKITGATSTSVKNSIKDTTPSYTKFTQIKTSASLEEKSLQSTPESAIQNISRCMYYIGGFTKIVHDIVTVSDITKVQPFKNASSEILDAYKLMNEIISAAVNYGKLPSVTTNYTLTNVSPSQTPSTPPILGDTTVPNAILNSINPNLSMMSAIMHAILTKFSGRYTLHGMDRNVSLFNNQSILPKEKNILLKVEHFNTKTNPQNNNPPIQLYELIAEMMKEFGSQLDSISIYILSTTTTPLTWVGIQSQTIKKYTATLVNSNLGIDDMRDIL